MGTNRVILMGGLGNQLFQYAFAVRLSNETETDVILDANFLAIRRDNQGRPDIAKFHLDNHIKIEKNQDCPNMLRKLMGLSLRKHLEQRNSLDKIACGLLRAILTIVISAWYKTPTRVVICTDNGFVPIKFHDRNTLYLGYFQSYKYGQFILNSSKNFLELSDKGSKKFESFVKLAELENPLLVHIRLTDYRNEPNFGIPSKEYFRNSILFHFHQNQYNCIWLFSDEPKNAILYIPVEFRHLVRNVSNEISDPVYTFEVMRLAKGYVIANSSYSWWAARASYSVNPLVTYPEPWFEKMPTPTALCPPNWHGFAR